MADLEEIREWLNKADEDRLVVEVLMRTGEELTLPCMFHLQQMLEKLLKALILVRGIRTHTRFNPSDRLIRNPGCRRALGD
jgi:HEPN domain-containing protein